MSSVKQQPFAEGDIVSNFSVLTVEHIPEMDGTAYVMRHKPSSARLLYIANNDVDKAFSIGFKTPPADDTGVFHIIEHTVLCGSERFPVKEPFVDLIKTSMNTFLNAMTFDDKTLYPISSTNEQDLLNMMDVYMDAVLHPLVAKNELAFRQEGWHYELTSNQDDDNLNPRDTSAKQPIYNGIVYNEMKGALSDPAHKISARLEAVLYPNTAYGFESGGTPGSIPHLTYESFQDTYHRHYNLGNSYLILYGNMKPERFLEFLDSRYLTPYAKASQSYGAPNPLNLQDPVVSLNNILEADVPADNLTDIAGYVVGTAHDKQRLLAIDILLDAYCNDNSAPLKKALLDMNLAGDVSISLADGILQPYVEVAFRKVSENGSGKIASAVEDAVKSVLENGFDESLVEAALHNADFKLRENAYGSCNAIQVICAAMEGWLYDEDQATACLKFEDDMKALYGKLGSGYYEQLLREIFLENPHKAAVQMIAAKEGGWEPADSELEQFASSITADDVADINTRLEALRTYQETVDPPELSSLVPRLTLADAQEAPEEKLYSVETHEPESGWPVCIVRHHANTQGIVYASRYYDASVLPFEDLPYLGVLGCVLGELGCESLSSSQLHTLVRSQMGDLNFSVKTFQKADDLSSVRILFQVFCSCLSERVEDAAALSRKVMLQSCFTDREAMRNLLAQELIRKRIAMANGGHLTAPRRATSYFCPKGVLEEAVHGIDYFRFLRSLVNNFDERFEQLADKLGSLCNLLFRDENCTLSFMGSDDELQRFWGSGASISQSDSLCNTQRKLVIPAPINRKEAFITEADVSYNALVFNSNLLNKKFSGAWHTMAKVLSYDLLWGEIRVKGGAYGAGCGVARTGTLQLSSYRDPNVRQTYEVFKKSGQWLQGIPVEQDALESYAITAIADLDKPVKPKELRGKQMRDFFEGITPQRRMQIRSEVLDSACGGFTDFGQLVEEALRFDARCALVHRDAAASCADEFEVIDILNENG